MAWPKGAKDGQLPIEVSFDGYGFHATSLSAARAAEGGGRILLAVTRQGEGPCRDAAYYENIRTNVCRDFCFRRNDGAPEKTDFCRMLLRGARALQWAKTLPQWNGRDATRVTCPVALEIGLGDYVCPPSGETILYRNLRGAKSLTVKQNKGHGADYGPDVASFTISAPPARR